jgi:HEAT repeat protein
MRQIITLLALVCLVFVFSSPLEAKSKREEAQDLMKELAESRDDRVRAEAAWQLGQMGATDAVPALIQALEDRESSVRANAAASLWKLGDVSRPAMPALRRALNDPHPGVISNAAGALVMLGVPRTELAPVYKRLLLEKECRYRIKGIRGLMDQVPPTDLFHDALECSRDPDLDNKFAAGDLLRELMDAKNREMIPLILDALKESGDNNASDLALAIVKFKPPVAEAVLVLENLLRSANPVNRSVAATSLGLLKGEALVALPTLVKVLGSDPDAGVREAAAKAIGAMGKSAREAVPALIQAAKDDRWPKVRQAAIQALGEMGEGASEAIPVLSAALNDPDPFIRTAARNALFRVDPKNKAMKNVSASPAKMVSTIGSNNLFEDAAGLVKTLSARFPEAVQLTIYENFAIATAPEPSSSSGYGRFTYRNGSLTGPDNGTATCKDTFRFADVDFSVVPRLVKEAPGLAERPNGKVSHVILSRGVFCKDVGWIVYVMDGSKSGSMVEFKPDGKLKQVTSF